MTISPSSKDFDLDTFRYEYEAGRKIEIIFISEAFAVNGVTCNIESSLVHLIDGDAYTRCPSIIGLGNGRMKLLTQDVTLLGKKLSMSNIDKCYVEILNGNE